MGWVRSHWKGIVTTCALLFVLTTVGIRFRDYAVCRAAEYFLRASGAVPSDLIVDCQSSSLRLRELHCNEMVVRSEKDPHFALSAASCTISFFTKTHGITPSPHVTLRGLSVSLPSTLPQQRRNRSPFQRLRTLYRLGSFLTVESGRVALDKATELSFSFREIDGQRALVVDHPEPHMPPLFRLRITQQGRELSLRGECTALDVASLSRLSILAEYGIVPERGIIDCKGMCVLDAENMISSSSYGFSAKRFAVRVGDIRYHAAELTSYMGKETHGHSLFDAEWHIRDGAISKRVASHEFLPLVREMTLHIPARSREPITARGALNHGGRFQPFEIQGRRTNEEQETTWDLALTASPMTISSHISYSKAGNGGIKCDVSGCDAPFLEMVFRETLESQYSGTPPALPSIEKGVFSGSAYAHLTSWHISGFDVEQCALENFVLRGTDAYTDIIGDELQCFFRLTGKEVPSWGVHAQNVAFPKLNVSAIHGDFAIHERYVIPSTMQATVEGTQVKATVRGVLPSVKIALETAGGCAPLCAAFLPNHSFSADELSMLISLSLRTTLQFHTDHISSVGTIAALSLSHSDTVQFSGSFTYPTLWTKGALRETLQECSFEGQNTSALIANLPLAATGQLWRLRGTTSLRGTVTKKKIALLFVEPTLSFQSPALSIHTETPQANASFTYSYETQTWQGAIPIRGSTVSLPTTGLTFTDTSGSVDIDGKEVHISSLSSRFNDLEIEGRMVVHFPESHDVRLELITTKLDGEITTLQHLLTHFDDFKNQTLPLTGKVTQESGKGLRVKASLTPHSADLQWGADLRMHGATYPLAEETSIEDLAFDIEWNGVSNEVAVRNINGAIVSEQSQDRLSIKNTSFTMRDNVLGTFSILVGNETYDVLSLRGAVEYGHDGYSVALDETHAHLYALPLSGVSLTLDKTFSPASCAFEGTVSIDQCKKIGKLASRLGILPQADAVIDFLSAQRIKARPHLKVAYDAKEKSFAIEASGEKVTHGDSKHGAWSLTLEKKGDTLSRWDMTIGGFSWKSRGTFSADQIGLSVVEVRRNKGYAKFRDVVLDVAEKKVACTIDTLYTRLEDIQQDIPQIPDEYREYLTGALTSTGTLHLDFSHSVQQPIVSGKLELIAPKIGKGALQLMSHHPIEFTVDPQEGIVCTGIELLFSSLETEAHWAQIECGSLSIELESGDCAVRELRALIPPEMFLFIARTESIPFLQAGKKSLKWYGLEVPWENQVDIEASIDYTKGIFSCSGKVKDGYYWVGNSSLFIHDVSFSLGKESASCRANMEAYKQPVQLRIDATLAPTLRADITLEDMRPAEDRLNDSRTTMSIHLANDAQGNINVKSIQGGMYGVDVAFQQQSHRTTKELLVLSGKLRCHMPFFATVLPYSYRELIDTLGMGKGYEVSGDVFLDWNDLHKSTFAGYLKGKNFEFLNARIQTLMGTLRLSKNEVSIDQFTISDEAGQLTIPEVQCLRDEGGEWTMTIPQVSLHDFRPSLLRTIGKYRGKMKPLVVREMLFQDITGTPNDLSSFTGSGNLAFTNTFKKEYNLLDIPFELIARLGIDMGLLVPVRGKLSYEIRDGRIYFTDLTESCSEGKRSKFYLSKTSPSFISLTGDLNVSIKMRQYVILKVTEPFILSITGSIKKPKYSLR